MIFPIYEPGTVTAYSSVPPDNNRRGNTELFRNFGEAVWKNWKANVGDGTRYLASYAADWIQLATIMLCGRIDIDLQISEMYVLSSTKSVTLT